jgi:hypothetical protein
VPNQLVTPVEPRRVSAQEPLHAGGQIRAGRFDHQMEMIGHKAERMSLPAGLPAGLPEGLQEQFPVRITQKNWLAPITPIHQVVNRSLVFDSKLSRHGPDSLKTSTTHQ